MAKKEKVMFTSISVKAAFRELKETFGLNMPREQVRTNIRMSEKDPNETLIIGALNMYDKSYLSGYSIIKMPTELHNFLIKEGQTDRDHQYLVMVIRNANTTEQLLTELSYNK